MTTATNAEPALREYSKVERILRRREFGVAVALIVLLVVGSFVRPDVFLTIDNMMRTLRNAAIIAMIGYGMSFLITAGEFDLSVGSVSAVAAAITAVMITEGFSVAFTLLLVLTLAVLYGATQGLVITKLGLPSLIVTIGTLTLLRGGTLIITDNQPQSIPSNIDSAILIGLGEVITLPVSFSYTTPFTEGSQVVDSLPMQIVWIMVLLAIMHYLFFHTRFGYRTQFTGANTQAAKFTGINTDMIKVANFSLIAFLAAFAGISQLIWANTVTPNTGSGLELIVIAAVIIGGTDLFGGKGTMFGVLLGALIFAFTQNVLVLAGFGTQLFEVFTGIFIIGAVMVEAVVKRSSVSAFRDHYATPLATFVRSPRKLFAQIRNDGFAPDASLGYITIHFLVISAVTVLAISIAGALNLFVGDFSLLFVSEGLTMLVTVPIVLYIVLFFLMLLTAVSVYASLTALGEKPHFDRLVPVVVSSYTPIILVFLPFVLAGFNVIAPVIAVAALITMVPIWAALYLGVRDVFDIPVQHGLLVVGQFVVLLVLIFYYLGTNL